MARSSLRAFSLSYCRLRSLSSANTQEMYLVVRCRPSSSMKPWRGRDVFNTPRGGRWAPQATWVCGICFLTIPAAAPAIPPHPSRVQMLPPVSPATGCNPDCGFAPGDRELLPGRSPNSASTSPRGLAWDRAIGHGQQANLMVPNCCQSLGARAWRSPAPRSRSCHRDGW